MGKYLKTLKTITVKTKVPFQGSVFDVFEYLKTLKALKAKRPPDLDKQFQKAQIFKNIKNNEKAPLFLVGFKCFQIKRTPE